MAIDYPLRTASSTLTSSDFHTKSILVWQEFGRDGRDTWRQRWRLQAGIIVRMALNNVSMPTPYD